MARKKTAIQKYGLLVVLAVLLVIAALVYGYVQQNNPVSEAARGGGRPPKVPASITLDQADPHLGDSVTFTTAGGGNRIQVACYGLGLEVVYAADQVVGTSFLLGGTSSIWLSRGGSSDCYAWLIVKDMTKVLASTRFTAAGAR